jgi:hypothetical protein
MARIDDTSCTTARPSEQVQIHTRLEKLALGIEESRAYWAHFDLAIPRAERAARAFEQRWFGAKSMSRVRTLLSNFTLRYDAYPEALTVLRGWKLMEPATRRAICHWHLQLADPLYRCFTGQYLVARRQAANPSFDRDVVARWVAATYPDRWGPSTIIQFASKLLSAGSEAGLLAPRKDPREPLFPKITDVALEYLLYLLRGVRFSGTLTHNPYLASVGLVGAYLEQRLRSVPGIDYRRMIDLDDFTWKHASLSAWAEATL